jgi:hypothetical protein
MRHPAFLGLRSDKEAFDVIREKAMKKFPRNPLPLAPTRIAPGFL